MLKIVPPTRAPKTFYFLKSADGRYLQATLNASTGDWRFWLDAKRAWSPCCPTVASAEQYRAAAEPVVGALSIVQEAL